jgi:hypothetical protein
MAAPNAALVAALGEHAPHTAGNPMHLPATRKTPDQAYFNRLPQIAAA